ncbi:MAG: LAGLIDADG family homing endonuclease, partial [Candidatus Nanohaloarchaea archaeon]
MEELDDVESMLPPGANISDIRFEASDIVLYTDSKDFFLDNSETVRELVSKLKKRIEVRPTSKLFKTPETAEEKIEEAVPEEAELEDTIFQPSLGKVIIRVKRPSKLKNAEDKIKEEALWSPQFERVPAIDSKIVDKARELTVEDPEFRKDFLHDVGKKIRLDKSVGDEWIRISSLGGFRQVGRSCVLVQTEESNVLMDAGISPGAEPGSPENYPYLNAPELNLQDLDAVVLSHAHMDHCLTPETPVTMADGTRKPIAQVEKGEKLKTVNWETGEVEEGKCTGTKEVKDEEYLEIETNFNNIKASEDHKFFKFEELEVKEVKAEKLEQGDLIPRKSVQRPKTKNIELEEPEFSERISLTEKAKSELIEKRQEKGLSQRKASKNADKGINFVNDLENKYDSVYKENLESLLNLYNIDSKQFFIDNDVEKTVYPENLNSKLAQFIGYFYGDGHRDVNRLRLTDKNRECLKEYNDLVESLFNYRGNIRNHPDRSKEAYTLEINNVGIVKFLEDNFEGIYLNSSEGTIPSEIKRTTHSNMKSFIRGLFDAEGDIGNIIRISQSSSEVRKEIQNLLSSIGIKASNSDKDIRVSISQNVEIKKFIEKVGSSHPVKKEKQERLLELIEDSNSRELMPVRSEDLHRILEEAGMTGRVGGSPNYKNLETCLVDWYRRDSDSLAGKETVKTLIQTLEERVTELKSKESDNIPEARKSISVTRETVVNSTSSSMDHVQLIEDKGKPIAVQEEVSEYLETQIESAITDTLENIESLKKLLSMDVEWHQINNIEKENNEYGYLVDIRVDPHHNFIANDQVVHNCGMIPYLYKMGYDGPLYCTKPTRDMMIMLCLDYIGLAHSENNTAPYDSSAIKKAVKRTITPDYGEVTDITPDMRLTLKNSGHIIGSALTHLHVGEGLHNILYTGDYNYDTTETLRQADTDFQRVETMITESTYGGRDDKQTPREEANKKFLSKVKQTLSKGGKVIVPVFAVGRSQEVLALLADEMDRSYFDYNVYVDGMINDANALHTAYPEFLSKKIQNKVIRKNSPFLKENIKAIGSYNERQEVYDDDACIILTTSGSITGGPIMSYLKREASEPE